MAMAVPAEMMRIVTAELLVRIGRVITFLFEHPGGNFLRHLSSDGSVTGLCTMLADGDLVLHALV